VADVHKLVMGIIRYKIIHMYHHIDIGGLVVSVLATGPKVRGFDPDRGRWIFKGDKNPEAQLSSEGK
jgi:hypothetical protein